MHLAQLKDYIDKSPNGIIKRDSENRIRQRQRTQLLEHCMKPKIIFDEATSALDNINENAFQKSINKIKLI